MQKERGFQERAGKMTEEEYKKIMLDFSDVNPNCPESVRKYGERCALAGEIWFGMKWGEKEVARLQKEIERLKEKRVKI